MYVSHIDKMGVYRRNISCVSAVDPLVAFPTSLEETERSYSFVLSLTHKISVLYYIMIYPQLIKISL
jgi:hypothetical protein